MTMTVSHQCQHICKGGRPIKPSREPEYPDEISILFEIPVNTMNIETKPSQSDGFLLTVSMGGRSFPNAAAIAAATTNTNSRPHSPSPSLSIRC